jgi:hypothetical protein
MRKNSNLTLKISAVALALYFLWGPLFMSASVEGAECEEALRKCVGTVFLSTFLSSFNPFVLALSASSCLMGYEWCLLYYA